MKGFAGIKDVYFAGVDITRLDDSINLSQRDIHDTPERIITAYKRARKDGKAFVLAEYQETVKTITGWIAAPSREIMEQMRDLLISKLQGQQGALDMPVSGKQRRFYAAFQRYQASDSKGGYEEFTLIFALSDPLGYDLAEIDVGLGAAITSFQESRAYTFGGSYDSVPKVILTINSFTGSGSRDVTVTNPATGIYMKVSRTWVAGDVVIFDPANQKVTVNNIEVPFTGGLLSWAVGPGDIMISDTFTARNISAALKQRQRYL